MTLVEFLLARIAEDEEVAHQCLEVVDADRTEFGREMARRTGSYSTVTSSSHCGIDTGPRGSVEATPGRIIAECEAKLRIIAFYLGSRDALASMPDGPDLQQMLKRMIGEAIHESHADALKPLALPYVNHPDYKEEWTR